MSECTRATNIWRQRLAGFVDAINRRAGVFVCRLNLAMKLISAATTVSRKAFSVSPNAFLEVQWCRLAALFLPAAAYTLHRNEHFRVGIQQDVKLQPCSKDIMSAALKAAHDLYEETSAAKPVFRRFYQSWKHFRYARYLWYRIAEASFSNFMAGQQRPFR